MSGRQKTETKRAELVETHNIALSIMRLQGAPYDSGDRWKRALYHAAGIAGVGRGQLEKIRQALELP